MREVEVEIQDFDEAITELSNLEDEYFEETKPNTGFMACVVFLCGVVSLICCFNESLWFLLIIPCILLIKQFFAPTFNKKDLDFLETRIFNIESSLNFLKNIDGTLYTDGKDLYVDAEKVENIVFEVIKSDETKLIGKKNTLKGYELLLFVED